MKATRTPEKDIHPAWAVTVRRRLYASLIPLLAVSCGTDSAVQQPTAPAQHADVIKPRVIDRGAIPLKQPSDNADRRGTYFLRSGVDRFDFWVRVPDQYGPDNPAGLLIFFHGIGTPPTAEQQSAKYHVQDWDQTLCEGFNLICLHATFGDGMANGRVPEKVEAAVNVIGQIMADYKVIAGRGIVSAFSNGGWPIKGLLHALGEKNPVGTPGYAFPFTTAALYSTVLQVRRLEVPKLPAINWFHYVGETEWPFARIGIDALPIYAGLAHGALATDTQHENRPVDINFWIRPGIGHQMPKQPMVDMVAETFARADTFLAPFVYTPDLDAPALRTAVEQVELLRMGAARSAAQTALKNTDNETQQQAQSLLNAIEARANNVVAEWKKLSTTDPVLAKMLYTRHLSRQFDGHPAGVELKAAMDKLGGCHACSAAEAATRQWLESVSEVTDEMPRLRPAEFDKVQGWYQAMKPTALHARVIKNFLDIGAGRFADVPEPKPVSVPFAKTITNDGNGKEWRRIKPLPAPFSKIKKSFIKAAWNADGLHFLAQVPDTTIEPAAAGKTFQDYIQVWLEKNGTRGYHMHEDAAEYYCAPGSNDGQGHSKRVHMKGADEPSTVHQCRWSKSRKGYTLEMTIPATELNPAKLARGTRLPMNFCINDNRKKLQQFWTDKHERSAWATPHLWGMLELAGGPR